MERSKHDEWNKNSRSTKFEDEGDKIRSKTDYEEGENARMRTEKTRKEHVLSFRPPILGSTLLRWW